jgi:hypothetical protein
MAANGISTLATKRARQDAKLTLAGNDRTARNVVQSGRYADTTADATQLPTRYKTGDNFTGNIVDNANTGGLVIGRPWTSAAPASFTLTEVVNIAGASIVETNTGPLTLVAKATSYQVNPIEDGYISVNGTTIKTTALGSRGHTLAVISPAGATVGSINTYDTFESAPGDGGAAGRTALTSALNAVSTGNYIVLVSWDACSFDTTLRSALNTGYGTTLTTTWASTRYSHIVIAKKL